MSSDVVTSTDGGKIYHSAERSKEVTYIRRTGGTRVAHVLFTLFVRICLALMGFLVDVIMKYFLDLQKELMNSERLWL